MNVPLDKTCVAYLGPVGTYSHQITGNRFGDSVNLVEKSTITDVFNALSPSIPIVVVPKENSIYGPVIETYDLMRSENMGKQIFIREELTMAISHSLLVRKGTTLQNIRRVLSHEQALGQCTEFLSKYIPNAKRVPVRSTAAAAEAASVQEGDAAICSTICTKLFGGLVVLNEGIQNVNRNYTKFWVLASSKSNPIPGWRREDSIRSALLKVQVSSTQSNLSPLLGTIKLPIKHIDRRPSLCGEPFKDIYFIEVQFGLTEKDQTTSEESTDDTLSTSFSEWEELVVSESKRICSSQWQCEAVGIW